MALIVEDGTGIADADAYVSTVAFKTYCDDRGLSYAGKSDTEIDQRIRLATEYIDTINRYKGNRLKSTQSLQFPRSNLYDWGGDLALGLPTKVKQACSELALRALTGELYQDLARGGEVKSESVGELSVTYADGAPRGQFFTAAMNMLQQYVRAKGAFIGEPRYGTSEAAYFELGMMDNPSPVSDLAP